MARRSLHLKCPPPWSQTIGIFLVCAVLVGCEGKSLVDDNPVFAEVPPRRSLTNSSTVNKSPSEGNQSAVQMVSATQSQSAEVPELTGNTIVAEVNGRPIFLDDLIGSLRLSIEADDRISPEQRQSILYAQVRNRLDSYVQQEIVLHALKQAIPEDRRQSIDETLEAPFQEVIANIRKDRGVETNAELNEILAAEGLSIDLLRESFVRIQKVNGYIQTLAPPPSAIDRASMVDYYREHVDEFTSDERVRWQEIVLLFSDQGGKTGAEKKMTEVQHALQQGTDFADVAVQFSDSLSAERRGDMGWLERGGLADKELEEQLFKMDAGQTTKVYERNDRLEIYRVVDHQRSETAEFGDVQAKIEQILKQNAQEKAREEVLADLRKQATVVTMFDETQPPQTPGPQKL